MIVGEINSGKTTMTQQILEIFCRDTDRKVTVIDLAPEITPQDLEASNNTTAIGGGLQIPDSESISYHRPRIHPPRLSARDEHEAEALAAENLRTIDALFDKALLDGTDAIFINDCSLYLHAGSAGKLLDVIRSSPTSVVNGYFGEFFSKSPISARERNGMKFLIRHCDRLIKIS
jgi:hypothetical protein